MNYEFEGKEYFIEKLPKETTEELIKRCEYIFVTKKNLDFNERIRLSIIWHYVKFCGNKYSPEVMSKIME